MTRNPPLCVFAFLAFGCGAQNVSYVTQSFRADGIVFSDIVNNSILFNGLDSIRVRSSVLNAAGSSSPSFSLFSLDTLLELTATFSDSGDHLHSLNRSEIDSVFGLTIDSLNSLCFDGFTQQLTKRFSNLVMVNRVSASSSTPVTYELRVRTSSIGDRTDNAYGSIVNKKVLILDVEMRDKRNDSLLFRLQSKGEAITSRYSNPWKEAVRLAVARIVDYIKSNGEDYVPRGS